LAGTSEEPSGTLRLTAPFDYGIGAVVPAIADFTQRYPQCKVDALLSDQTLDVVSGNIEVAIRVGWLVEPGLQARKIGTFRQLLVAPPALRKQVTRFTQPGDIAQLPFVANTALRNHLRWSFSSAAMERQTVNLQASIFLDATLAVRAAVCAVFPAARYRPAKVRAFVDLLAAREQQRRSARNPAAYRQRAQ